MFSVVWFKIVMIIVIVVQTIVTVARTILTIMNRVNFMIALMCTGLLDWMSMGSVGVFMNGVVCLGEMPV